MPNRLLPVPPALPVPWLPEAAACRCVRDHVADRLQAALDASAREILSPLVDRVLDLAARHGVASYVVELDGKGGVRAYDLNARTPVEPLVAVMDLDDDAADQRQMEAREAAVGRLWARDRWGA